MNVTSVPMNSEEFEGQDQNGKSEARLEPGIFQTAGTVSMSAAAFQTVLQTAIETSTLEALDHVHLLSCRGAVFAPANEFQAFREAVLATGLDLVVEQVAPARKRSTPRKATAPLIAKAGGA